MLGLLRGLGRDRGRSIRAGRLERRYLTQRKFTDIHYLAGFARAPDGGTEAIAAFADAKGAATSRMSIELWQKLNESFEDAGGEQGAQSQVHRG